MAERCSDTQLVVCILLTIDWRGDTRYPLNDDVKELFGICPNFLDPIKNDIAINEENLHTGSDVASFLRRRLTQPK